MAKQTGIRKLPNGRYRARYFAGYDSQGKRRYPARTFNTQAEAVRWRAEEVSVKRPGSVDGSGLTLERYLDQWLASKRNLRQNTKRMYEQHVECYIKPNLGRVKLTRLRPSHVQDWQNALLDQGLAKSTVAAARAILHGAFKQAVRMEMIRSNPVAAIDGPGTEQTTRYPLSIEEALRFVEACQGARFGLLFELSLTCGLRPEELLGLRWQDLELSSERGAVRVRKVVHYPKGGGWIWEEPKTASGKRAVVFPGELAMRLLDHRKDILETKLKAGQYWQNNDLVFPSRSGEPVRYQFVHKHFRATLEKAGLPSEITPYCLRHFFVTSSLVAGVDPKTVSNEAGHSTVSFTLQRYGAVLEEMHQSASDKREGLLKARKVKQ